MAGAGAVSALHDEERERAAADVFDVRVSTGGTGVTYDDEGLLRLTFAVDNRGPGVRLGLPRLRSPAFTLLPGRPPQPVAAGAAALLVVRVRPDCARVVAAPGGLRLQLPVVPPSGREHLVSVTVDEPLMLALARQGCDRR